MDNSISGTKESLELFFQPSTVHYWSLSELKSSSDQQTIHVYYAT